MKKTIIITLVVVVVTAFLFMYIPERIQCTLTVSTGNGETAEADIDILYFSRLILPSYVKGTISIDGIEYVDRYTMLKKFPSVSDNRLFPSDWWETKQSVPYNMIFLKSDCTDVNSALLNSISVLDIVLNKGECKIHFMYADAGNQNGTKIEGISFWGPAKNGEEAKQIAESFGYKVP